MKLLNQNRRNLIKALSLSSLFPINSFAFGPKNIFNQLLGKFEQTQDDDSLLSVYADKLKDTYDVVIVGSGYGASISAARLCEEFGDNLNICVLERGKEFKPSDLPKNLSDLTIRSEVRPSGLIDQSFATKSDLDILQSNGLGGTSLINAAITVRPEKLVFEQKEWPKKIQEEVSSGNGLGKLEKYYKLVEKSLASSKNDDVKKLKKSVVLVEALENRNVPTDYLSLAINYKDSDLKDATRPACTMCGDCCSGCRVGAKNTLGTNYLSFAKENGANIFTKVEVLKIEKKDGEYILKCRTYHNKVYQTRYVRAKRVILGAGSMGSTKVLLNSKVNNFNFSNQLGKRLSLNGDVLGLCYNGKEKTEAVGFGTSSRKKILRSDVGPLITTFGNYRKVQKGSDISGRFLLLDGAIPSPIASITATGISAWAMLNRLNLDFSKEQWKRVERDLPINQKGSAVNADGALNHSTLFLSCGHDSSKGVYSLDDIGNLKVKWDDVDKEPFFKVVTDEMKALSKEMGGIYIENPRTSIFGGKMVATHPLGGCPMGETSKEGVVNHMGKVFDYNGGFHEGLYVLDGSIIPRSLGATPLLTISALSERAIEKIIEEIKIDI